MHRGLSCAIIALVTLCLVRESEGDDFDVTIHDKGSLGMQLDSRLQVTGFRRGPKGQPLPAEDSGWIRVGDRLIAVNERSVEDQSLPSAASIIARADHPKILRFRASSG